MTPEDVADVFAPFAPVDCRAMFGGLGIYCEGVMFALVADGEVYMKADAATEAVFRAAGSAPFTYEAKGRSVRMSYWRLPAAAFDDEAALTHYANLAMEAAHRSAAARKPRCRTPSTAGGPACPT